VYEIEHRNGERGGGEMGHDRSFYAQRRRRARSAATILDEPHRTEQSKVDASPNRVVRPGKVERVDERSEDGCQSPSD
jgi:hypothetical protein